MKYSTKELYTTSTVLQERSRIIAGLFFFLAKIGIKEVKTIPKKNVCFNGYRFSTKILMHRLMILKLHYLIHD